MLILTRRAGESIRIGDDIVVTVIEVSRDQLRVGIDAPRSVTVHRQEVYAAIMAENDAARHSGSPDVDGDPSESRGSAVSASSIPRRPTRPN